MARGKSKGRGRGSGKRFAAQSAEEIEARNARLEAFDAERIRRRAEAAEEENGEGDDDAAAEREAMLIGMKVATMSTSGQEPKEPRKGIIEIDNPNLRPAKPDAEVRMTRKEREEAEKVAAAAAYQRKHKAGLTEEYRRDMAKLAEVKKRREQADSKAKEKEAEEAEEAEKKKKADAEKHREEKKKKKSKGSDELPKLDKITVKKMKPAAMKDALKLRGLEIQGNAKQLTERLLDYEKKR